MLPSARSEPAWGQAMEGSMVQRGQSTLEWVIGAAVILGTLVVGIIAWNQGLVTKIGTMVQQMVGTQ